jgi:hypothetical protein
MSEEKKKDMSYMTPEQIFINLTVISNISSGNKLVMDEKFLNIDNSYFPFITRWLKGMNRSDILSFIGNVLENAFEANDKWVKEKNGQMLIRLMSDLKNALKGLNNLKQTYPNDKLVHSEIDVMMENIHTKLHNNSNILQFMNSS